jgi:hypothetical protein
MDAAERALLETTVRDALERAVGEATTDAGDVLVELGWLEMLDSEARDAVAIVFTALGATNASAAVVDDVVASALGAKPRADLAVLLPDFASWGPPGRIDGDDVRAHGLARARITSAEELLVVCDADGQRQAVTVPIEAVTITPVRGVDPEAGIHVVRVEHKTTPAPGIDAAMWPSAVAAGRRAIAHQIAGACRAMLDLACAHAVERVQFGRPIARFQAVRHRLAEALIAIEALDAALGASWDEPNATTAALGKAIAGRTARTVAAQCQQVLAGVGFTTDHAFHRFLKRTMVLEGIFGTADDIVTDIGRELIATRSVPTLIEL